MKKLIFLLGFLFVFIFGYSQTYVLRPRVDADLLNGQLSTYYLDTSSLTQAKSGQLSLNGLTIFGDKINADYAEGSAATDGTRYYDFLVAATVDPAASAEVNAGYFRYNKTGGSNGTYTINGLEGVAGSSYADEAGTFRGVYGRTYTSAGATATMRTAIGGEFSARAGYSGGTDCVAENGTAFTGARIWMAPYFTSGSLSNVNNFHGLWLYNEHTSNTVTNAIFVDDAGGTGGWTNGISFNGATIGTAEIVGSQGEKWENVTTDGTWTTDAAIDQTITNTVAGGERAINTYISHTTNALTGTLTGIKASARINVASAAGTVRGGHFAAGNMDAGYALSTATGVFAEVTNKIPSGAIGWTNARGLEINMDLNQGSAGNVTTIDNAYMIYGVYNLPTTATYSTVTNGYGIFLRNEQVGGNGQLLDAAFYIDDLNMGGSVHGWDYGIDFSGIGSNSGNFGTADIRLANGELIDNSTDDIVKITVGGVEAVRFVEATTTQALVGNGTAALPSISFINNPTTGFWTNATDISVSVSGAKNWEFDPNIFRGNSANSPALSNTNASATTATVRPNKGDADVGLGSAGTDSLSLIAGGVEGIRVAEGDGAIKVIVTDTLEIKGEGILRLAETTTPYALDSYGEIYTKSDNELYFQDGGGTEHMITLGASDYGEMGNVFGSSATEVLGDANWHAMYHANITGAAPHLNSGFSFVAGSSGTIASSSTGAGSTVIFTDNDHGLVAGDFITTNTMSDGSYDGVYEVQSATTHTFTVNETNTEASETGTWQMGSYLLVASTGVYRGAWNACFTQSLANAQTTSALPYHNLTQGTKVFSSHKLSNATDIALLGGNGIMSLTAGDRLWFAVQTSAAQTITFIVRNISIH